MTSAATRIEPSGPFSELDFFDDNLLTLALPAATWREALAAKPKGRIVLDADRTPQLELDGRILGAPIPEEQLEAYAARVSPQTVFIVFGLGMGHVARALRAVSDAPVVVYEPDPGLLRRVLEAGPTDLGGIPIFTSLLDLAGVWLKIGLSRLEGIVIRSSGYSEAYPEPLLALPAAVHETFQRINITENTYQLRARVWVDDVLTNLKTIAGTVPFVGLMRKFEGVPAFIVGAGPSLDKNVALLNEAKKKGIVIAVNSSARALARNGVEPQVLACIESHDSSHLLAQLPYIDRVVRAFSICAAPKILETGKGPLLPIHEGLPQLEAPLRELMHVPGLAVCGSVSTAAFSLAEALGCNPIVFVGQDLAYTSGRTHAGGTWWEDSRATAAKDGTVELSWSEALKKVGHRHEKEPMTEVPAWGGKGTALSGSSFTGIRIWLEAAAALIHDRNPSLRLVNATEGGARVEGFEERTLAEVLAELEDRGITTETITETAAATRAPLTREALAGWAKDQSTRTARVRRAARRLRKVAAHARAAVSGEHAQSVHAAFAALEDAEREVSSAVAAAPLVDLWAHGDVIAASEAQMDDTDKTAKADAVRATERGIRVAEIVENAARELTQRLEAAANSIPSSGSPRNERNEKC